MVQGGTFFFGGAKRSQKMVAPHSHGVEPEDTIIASVFSFEVGECLCVDGHFPSQGKKKIGRGRKKKKRTSAVPSEPVVGKWRGGNKGD